MEDLYSTGFFDYLESGAILAVEWSENIEAALPDPHIVVEITLEGLARNLTGFEGSALAVMDARCGQVYAGAFALRKGEVEQYPFGEDAALPIEELTQWLEKMEKPVFLVGDGARLCYNRLTELQAEKGSLRLAPPHLCCQRAATAGAAARAAWARGEAVEAGALVPSYLRLPQAERELLARKEK